jgi:nicotinate-nucleotide adenylyltransferase
MKRIGILGGSFNPPQIGHVAIANYVRDHNLVDEVCVMPCADHPYGKNLAPFVNRLAMCNLAFHGMPHVVISDMEAHLPTPSYTVQTLRHLQDTVHNAKFSLIIGSDTMMDIHNWKEFTEIHKLATLLEVPRGSNSPIPNVSATEIRHCIHAGQPITDLVPAPVAEYIQAHGLYR